MAHGFLQKIFVGNKKELLTELKIPRLLLARIMDSERPG